LSAFDPARFARRARPEPNHEATIGGSQ
jgi:hypothetical protein